MSGCVFVSPQAIEFQVCLRLVLRPSPFLRKGSRSIVVCRIARFRGRLEVQGCLFLSITTNIDRQAARQFLVAHVGGNNSYTSIRTRWNENRFNGSVWLSQCSHFEH